MNWGNAIVAGFVVFAVFVFSLVYKMVTSGNDLVDQRKHKQDRHATLQIRQSRLSKYLDKAIELQHNPEAGTISILVADTSASRLEGELSLTCLSRAASDEIVPLQLVRSDGKWGQTITLKNPHPGTWICQFQGKQKGEAFSVEKKLRL